MACCDMCKLKITKSNVGVICAICNKYFHQKCTNISNTLLKEAGSGKIDWKCTKCVNTRHEKSIVCGSDDEGDLAIDDLKTSMDRLSEELNALKIKQNDFNQSLDALINGVKNLKQLTSTMEQHSLRIKTLEEENKSLKTDLLSIKQRVDNLESKNISNFIQINNVPNIAIDGNNKENLIELLNKIHNYIKVEVSSDNIIKIYRRNLKKHHNKDAIQPIIVKYSSQLIRNKVLIASRTAGQITLEKLGFSVNNCNNTLYVNELLTAFKRNLLFKSKIFKKANNLKFLWVRNGRIYLKENEKSIIFSVKNDASLDEIKRKLNKLNNKS